MQKPLKILCLCKRRPQGRDLYTRPYGRFFYLPHWLSKKGHHVEVLLLSYKNDPPVQIKRQGIMWWSESICNLSPFRYWKCVQEVIRFVKPDWLVGFSDTYYGILAEHFSRKFGIHCAIDAYDNYESYIPWLTPLHKLWRKSIKNAAVVTAAGPQLARYLNRFRPNKKVHIVPMAADPTGFKPLDKQACRQKLNLPLDKKLIGYCGSMYHNRAIHIVFDAYKHILNENPNSLLVLSGRLQKKISLPENTKYLGYLSDDLVPVLLNCMDVLLVPNQLTKFGNFSYPVKLYEAMTCQIPVVATATEPAKWILNNEKQFLTRPGNPIDLAQKVKDLMQLGRFDYGEQNTWEDSCDILETALLDQT